LGPKNWLPDFCTIEVYTAATVNLCLRWFQIRSCMYLLLKILKNFRVVDYIVLTYCIFGLTYASIYHQSFSDGMVQEPSRYVVTQYHQAHGAKTFDEMVALGLKQGYYRPGRTPTQRSLELFEVIRFFSIIAMVSFLVMLGVPNTNGLFRFIRDWYPYFVVPICLYSVGWLNQVHYESLPFDDDLNATDKFLFGVTPALDFFPAWDNFWLEEFFNLSYFNFYYMGFMIGLPVYFTCTKEEFNFFLAIYILGFVMNFTWSILFPAAGPIFFYTEGIRFPYFVQGEIQQTGIGPITQMMRGLILSGEIPAGAIPSSHCSIAFIAAIFGFKHFGRWGFFYLFWSASLWISTVYLQQHYLIDVFAGLFVAWPVYYFFGRFMYRKIESWTGSWIEKLESRM
jgi:membrane-associated phospholipid phosphatase